MDLYDLSAYQFDLPPELIAQKPVEPRDHSRLMIVDKQKGTIEETVFHEIEHFLQPGDSLVFNNTKVIPARLIGKKESGAEIEVLITRNRAPGIWEALVRPAKKLPVGTRVYFSDTFFCQVLEIGAEGLRTVQFFSPGDFWESLHQFGMLPLPPYISRTSPLPEDNRSYQTVYASRPGAIASPTAGLHFTGHLLERLYRKGVSHAEVTLHVGMGTFRPVQSSDIREHLMHHEECEVDEEAARLLNSRDLSKKQVLVGTTCCRTVETAATEEGVVRAGRFETNIFIYPGYRFKYARQLLTNFHLPGSTLLMLVSAFAGYELIREAYRKAIEKKFRFFSYGDAMLIC